MDTRKISLPCLLQGTFYCIILSAILVSSGIAQTPAAVPVPRSDLGKKRAAYQMAFDDLLKGDPSLEKELRTAPRDSVLKRIDAQAKRAEQFTSARLELYQSMRTSFTTQLKNMSLGPRGNTDDLKESIESAQSAVLAESDAIDNDIKATKDPAMRLVLTKQQEVLDQIQKSLVRQQTQLGNARQSDKDAEAALQAAQASIQNLVNELAGAEERAKAIGEGYRTYYAELKSAVERVPVRAATTAVTAAVPSQPAQPAQPAQPQPSRAENWLWKGVPSKATAVSPTSLLLQLTTTGGSIHGHLTATIPPGSKYAGMLDLDFEGAASSGTAKYPCENKTRGLSGTVALTPVGKQLIVVVNIGGPDLLTEWLDRVGE